MSLRSGISFAKKTDVAQRRDLLLQYGALENEKDRKIWDFKQRVDVAEKIMKIITRTQIRITILGL